MYMKFFLLGNQWWTKVLHVCCWDDHTRWSTQVETVLNQYAKSFWPITILVCSILVLVSLLVIHFQLSGNSNFTPRSLLAACAFAAWVLHEHVCLLWYTTHKNSRMHLEFISSFIHCNRYMWIGQQSNNEKALLHNYNIRMEGLRRCDWGQYQPEFYAQCAPDGGTKLERLKETHLELGENMQTPHKNIYISDCSVFWFILSNLLLCICLFI